MPSRGGGATPRCGGTLRLAVGAEGAPSGARHLLPYFHVDLWPRIGRCLSPTAPAQEPPTPQLAAAGPPQRPIGARSAEFPASRQLTA